MISNITNRVCFPALTPSTNIVACAQVIDASRTDAELEAAEAKGEKMVRVLQDTRLDNRTLDLRTPTNNSIFKLQVWLDTVSFLKLSLLFAF